MSWIPISNPDDLEKIKKVSRDPSKEAAIIFKHSTRCGISAMAKDQVEQSEEFKSDQFPFYYLDLLNHRDISDQVAKEFNVVHQSPQLLVIKGGKCVFKTSHHSITSDVLRQFSNN